MNKFQIKMFSTWCQICKLKIDVTIIFAYVNCKMYTVVPAKNDPLISDHTPISDHRHLALTLFFINITPTCDQPV